MGVAFVGMGEGFVAHRQVVRADAVADPWRPTSEWPRIKPLHLMSVVRRNRYGGSTGDSPHGLLACRDGSPIEDANCRPTERTHAMSGLQPPFELIVEYTHGPEWVIRDANGELLNEPDARSPFHRDRAISDRREYERQTLEWASDVVARFTTCVVAAWQPQHSTDREMSTYTATVESETHTIVLHITETRTLTMPKMTTTAANAVINSIADSAAVVTYTSADGKEVIVPARSILYADHTVEREAPRP